MAAVPDGMTELGFIEKVDSYRLESVFFPSKVGGRPSWLAHNNIPPIEGLTCPKCGNLMSFLLQVYAPLDEKEDCFHRMIYVFICRKSSCYMKHSSIPFKIFRSQLPRQNDFYDYEPIPNEIERESVRNMMEQMRHKWGSVCEVCGYKGEKKCGACKVTAYCTKEHKKADWKNGHKYSCASTKEQGKGYSQKGRSQFVFPEFEIVTEPETPDEEDKEIPTPMPSVDHSGDNEIDVETESGFAETADKQFEKFKETISKDPDQIMRYKYGGSPLWVSNEHIAQPKDIPDCSCGAERIPEFQVLPQLLNHLDVDSLQESIDFGTLVVYTCSNNCTPGSCYADEFIWKQDFSDVHLSYK